ncbi:predicted protein [Lichtheimia corymbifera JMRC:FSU:9682]|uniref:Uncharacterized protein n=1 Tax=Lichtheimia corymbifera JMRC:FSU:9682 TaxID=1263082 RepID=A0A068SB01_9FUNG|nr:predicted protein [Lichtheimia corymbifera JMRC:FSU:9682]
MTQASIPTQHISVLSFIQDLMGCRVCSLPRCPPQEVFTLPLGLNMLDDGTCGSSNNKALISQQEHCMLAQWETAAAHTGSDEYQAICINNGIGNT